MVSTRFRTLVEMLAFRARQSPEALAFTFLDRPQTYAVLWEKLNRFGGYLQELEVRPGDRVVLALPNGPEFFAAFYGCQRAGCIPVPLFPGSGAERIFAIAGLCGSALIIVPGSTPEDLLAQVQSMGAGRSIQVTAFPERMETGKFKEFPATLPDDLGLIQYTSGSTGNPKGVQLSHENLLTNIEQMVQGMQITPEEVFVSWLPVYHDLGLILLTMAPLYVGARLHLLPANLRDVRRWPQAIAKHRATFTAAPDFAYRLLARHGEAGEFDLSSLRVALNAAEPVRAQTVRDFHLIFGLKNVMAPGYGLAEATVGVSMWTPSTAVRVDDRGFVSVGPPFPGVELQILDQDEPVGSEKIGEIAIRSPANSRGYYNNPGATQALMWRDGFLRSGDLGYLDNDGFLYITGRVKNIIKLSGETIWPQEVEEQVDAHPAVRYSAAIGVDRGRLEGEQLYVFAEIRDGETKPEGELHEIALGIVDSLHTHLGFRPGRAYLLRPRGIPMTYNGKIQHALLKEQYLDGSLRKGGGILYPEF